jgi:hypothetical protein
MIAPALGRAEVNELKIITNQKGKAVLSCYQRFVRYSSKNLFEFPFH